MATGTMIDLSRGYPVTATHSEILWTSRLLDSPDRYAVGIYAKYLLKALKGVKSWLTWKLVIGIFVGIIIGAIFYPFLESTYKYGNSIFIPQVEIVETIQKKGETLKKLYDSVEIDFSERIPLKYRSSFYLNIEITPFIPTKRVWVYDFYPSDC